MKLKYIDLFCGAGGLGEGFKQAGFDSCFHVDMDPWAINTIILREIYHNCTDKTAFFQTLIENNELPYNPEKLFLDKKDIIDYESIIKKVFCGKIDENYKVIINSIRKNLEEESHNIVIGGPPCQAYSLAKRSRMRAPTNNLKGLKLLEAKEKNRKRIDKYLSDEKHDLFKNYLKTIKDISPSAFVYENVPGILTAEKSINKKDQKAKIIDLFKNEIGTKAKKYNLLCLNRPMQTSLLNKNNIDFDDFIVDASDYGVPQKRKRFIIIGIRKDLTKNINYQNIFESTINHYRINEKITVKDAINDLPKLKSKSGNNYFLEEPLNDSLSTDYGKSLENNYVRGVFNHFARSHMNEDLKRYNYFSKFSEKNNRNATLYDLYRDQKNLLPVHKSASFINLIDKSGKKIGKYIDRFKVQMWDKPATTITAHISKDGHAFIHPSSDQNRSLTAREAARIQSFPDSYVFCGPRTEQFRQIGNAVPVKLANIIAEGIKSILREST
jgi:DNA (cytosine-5)-methyltransferase 1